MGKHRRAIGLVVVAVLGLIIGSGCDAGRSATPSPQLSYPVVVKSDSGPSAPAPSPTTPPAPPTDQPAAVPAPSTPIDPTSTSSPPAPSARPAAAPPPSPTAAPSPVGSDGAASPTAQAVANAYATGAARTTAAAVALLDRQTGTLYGAGDIDEPYASASLVKVFIATRLLVDGRADDPGVRDLMWEMITVSDDDAGTRLYALAGGERLVPWIADRYGITGLAPTDRPGYWGLTRVTARGVVTFYAAVSNDPAVAPWLLDAMGQAEAYGSDGFYQHFGLPSAATSWRVKQGWMCCLENLARMHSTGYIDGDRYAVALLASGPPSMYGDNGAETLTLMAQALLPNGTVPTEP